MTGLRVPSVPDTNGSIADEVDASRPPSRWRRLATNPTTSIGVILVGLIVAFTVISPADFSSLANARNVAADAAVLLIVATGMTYVIITAGIDLSVGSVLVFSGVVAAKVMNDVGGDGAVVITIGLVTALTGGLAWGVINGLLVTKAHIPPFIATLGTAGISLGAALLITGGLDISNLPLSLVTGIGTGLIFGQIPTLVLIAAGVCLVFAVLLARTRFGRYTYAIGSNTEAAQRAGINIDAHLIRVYALTGTLVGLAGFLSLARLSTTSVAGHATDNLDAIAAVVIGGTSLFGGVGAVLGTVFGVFIPSVLQNGFVIVGVQPYWEQVAVGIVLIAAVYLDQLRRSRRRQ